MNRAIERLSEILVPPTNVPEVSWESVTRLWGARLPQDYRDFIDTYGPGTFDGDLGIAAPIAVVPASGGSVISVLVDKQALQCRTFAGPVNFPAWPAEGSLLRWGTSASGADLFWKVAGSDSNFWPVVVISYRSGTAFELPYGMGEFIVRMLGPRLQRPADISGIIGYPHSLFLNIWDEAEAGRAGIDPWEYVEEFWEAEEEAREHAPKVDWIAGPGRHDSSNPGVPRLSILGFGVEQNSLRVKLEFSHGGEPRSGIVLGQAPRVGLVVTGPTGTVVSMKNLQLAEIGGSGFSLAPDDAPLNLELLAPGPAGDSPFSWREIIELMCRESEWRIMVSISDEAIRDLRWRHGIVTGRGMDAKKADSAVGIWP